MAHPALELNCSLTFSLNDDSLCELGRKVLKSDFDKGLQKTPALPQLSLNLSVANPLAYFQLLKML